MRRQRAFILALLLLVLFAIQLSAYEPIGGTYRDYVRVMALLGKSSWRPRQLNTYSNSRGFSNTITDQDHLWAGRMPGYASANLSVLDPELRTSANTHVPYNRNNGSQWEGRGLNAFLRGGVAFDYSGFSAILAPELWFAQNLSFDIMQSHSSIESEYGDYFRGIDRPQRFGSEPVVELWPGQSSISYERWNASVAITTENMWLGPTADNAIVMSNNAAGFPRLEIGTAEPANLELWDRNFGRFEAATWWGALPESEYFDSDPINDYRFTLGYTLGYVPPVLENLYLGFNRSYVSPMETINTFKLFQYFDPFFKSERRDLGGGEDDITQVASITAHWFLPEAGFEVYLEWARNDHTSDLSDFLLNPEHSQAYSLGFRKVYDLNTFYLAVEGEIARLGNNETTTHASPRPTFPYYRHNPVPQGYTNLGQELGAWIGTGSNSQYAGVKGYFPWGRIDAGITRHVFDNDYYLQFNRSLWPDRPRQGYNVRLLSTAGGTFFLGPFDLGAHYTFHRLWNWNWSSTSDPPNVNNTLALSLRYRLN